MHTLVYNSLPEMKWELAIEKKKKEYKHIKVKSVLTCIFILNNITCKIQIAFQFIELLLKMISEQLINHIQYILFSSMYSLNIHFAFKYETIVLGKLNKFKDKFGSII